MIYISPTQASLLKVVGYCSVQLVITSLSICRSLTAVSPLTCPCELFVQKHVKRETTVQNYDRQTAR